MRSLNMARRELANAHLELANGARARRADLKRGLAAGAIDLADAIHHKDAEGMRIYDLLVCVPRVGPIKARNILWAQMIGERRRCAELTLRQKGVLVAEVQR